MTATQTAGGCRNDLIGFVIWWDQGRAYVLVGYNNAYYCIPSIPATCTNGGKCFGPGNLGQLKSGARSQNPSVVFRHHRALVRREAADAFWMLRPV